MFDIEQLPVVTVRCDACDFAIQVPSNTDYWLRRELERLGWLVDDDTSFDCLLVCPACASCGLDLQTVLNGDFLDDWLEADSSHRAQWRDSHKRQKRLAAYRFCQGS